mmetsp:Transcript_27040/g.68815  ORF Transcript_27040/g.68815 Transcript_27040/m.68815 type:complete len:107 (+) Transcript_27040:543-863(+)
MVRSRHALELQYRLGPALYRCLVTRGCCSQILLVQASERDAVPPTWLDGLRRWAYQSCRAFLAHNTVAHPSLRASNGEPLRALKLGTCWGGWDCSNPSCARRPVAR